MKIFNNVDKNSMKVIAKIIIDKMAAKNINCIFLQGELGSGKTYLAGLIYKIWQKNNNIAILQNNQERQILSSPTYSLVKSYALDENFTLLHFDLYRLKNILELKMIGIEEMIFAKGNICVIEWPNLLLELLEKEHPAFKNYLEIKINFSNNKEFIANKKVFNLRDIIIK